MGIEEDIKSLFHYTSIEALEKILFSKKLRLSHTDQLNDLSEAKVVALKKDDNSEYESIDYLHDYFVAAFSKKGDLLSQWRAYGDNFQGCAIEFDFSGIFSRSRTIDVAMRGENAIEMGLNIDNKFYIGKAIYISKSKRKEIIDEVNNLSKDVKQILDNDQKGIAKRNLLDKRLYGFHDEIFFSIEKAHDAMINNYESSLEEEKKKEARTKIRGILEKIYGKKAFNNFIAENLFYHHDGPYLSSKKQQFNTRYAMYLKFKKHLIKKYNANEEQFKSYPNVMYLRFKEYFSKKYNDNDMINELVTDSFFNDWYQIKENFKKEYDNEAVSEVIASEEIADVKFDSMLMFIYLCLDLWEVYDEIKSYLENECGNKEEARELMFNSCLFDRYFRIGAIVPVLYKFDFWQEEDEYRIVSYGNIGKAYINPKAKNKKDDSQVKNDRLWVSGASGDALNNETTLPVILEDSRRYLELDFDLSCIKSIRYCSEASRKKIERLIHYFNLGLSPKSSDGMEIVSRDK